MKNENYGTSYFEYQDPIGKKTIRLKDRFQPYINKDSTVLDFGCGAGYLLDSIECKNKIGVDINPLALNEASKKASKLSILYKMLQMKPLIVLYQTQPLVIYQILLRY